MPPCSVCMYKCMCILKYRRYIYIHICTANIGHLGPGRNISRESSYISIPLISERQTLYLEALGISPRASRCKYYIVILLAARFIVYYHSHFHPFFGSNTSLLWMSFASQGLRRARMCIRRSSWAPAEALGALPTSTVENLGEESEESISG